VRNNFEEIKADEIRGLAVLTLVNKNWII